MEERSLGERLDEKYEDRGWGKYAPPTYERREEIPKLPISEKDCQVLSLLLGKLALQDQDEKFAKDLCDVFFEVQRRADFGNHYKKTEELEVVERKLWTLGTGQKLEEPKSTKSSSSRR